jgi:N-succinyldiaminopimelate aminotransferase
MPCKLPSGKSSISNWLPERMNPDLNQLQAYPFEKLRTLFAEVTPDAGKSPVSLAMGEPRHAPPAFVLDVLADSLAQLSSYPATRGSDALRKAIADWLTRRFKLEGVDADRQVLPLNGTREGLFAIAQACVDRSIRDATVVCPNPFYQIYEGAALLAGASPRFIDCTQDRGFMPDLDDMSVDDWQRCQLLYICSPGNPSGAVMPLTLLQSLIALAHEHDFIIVSDECYSELYDDESNPPPGLLQASAGLGSHDFSRCLAFHSLSKRSNLPGLRSGFVAGDADLLARFLLYRTYHGCAMPVHHQLASIAAWNDETHVIANRALYRNKFDAVLDILGPELPCERPAAGFYLWPRTPIDDQSFAQQLYRDQNVAVLPGSYLARDTRSGNPGANRVRLALVAEPEATITAAHRITDFLGSL